MANKRPAYVPDPSTQDVVLSIEEIEAIRGDKNRALADSRTRNHFMARVEATVRTYQREFSRLHRQVQEIGLERSASGTPTSLDPRDAVKFLPPEELAKLVEGHLRNQAKSLQGMLTDVGVAKRGAQAKLSSIKIAVVDILEDPSIPNEIKNRFRELVRRLPTDEDIVGHPMDVTNRLAASMDERNDYAPPAATPAVEQRAAENVTAGNVAAGNMVPDVAVAVNRPVADEPERAPELVTPEPAATPEVVEAHVIEPAATTAGGGWHVPEVDAAVIATSTPDSEEDEGGGQQTAPTVAVQESTVPWGDLPVVPRGDSLDDLFSD